MRGPARALRARRPARFPARRDHRRVLPIDTPAWVRDAVFYQIFPDRFARAPRLKPGRPVRAVGRAADHRTGFKGGDLYGVVERLDQLDGPRASPRST